MKNIKLTFLITISLFFLNSCDSGFDDLNKNKTAATTLNPLYLLNNAIVGASPVSGTLIYEIAIVQQIVSPNSGVIAGANFNQDVRGNTEQNWLRYYRQVIRNVEDAQNTAKTLPNRPNLLQMARIVRAHAYMVMTDTYGDIPYTEAGKGYLDQITKPKYDAQASIYADIIKELTEASAALDATKTIETGDVLYAGNVGKWKKFANSLLLRAGMRISNVDPSLAKATVEKAFAGGIITSNADNAAIKHDSNYLNDVGRLLNSTEASNFYLTAPFVNFLKDTGDPRLDAFATRYVGAKSGAEQVASRKVNTATDQIGMPMGFDNSSITSQYTNSKVVSFYDYSQLDRTRMGKATAPAYLVTAGQTNLLLAEAAFKGWVSGGAQTYYSEGIRQHMLQCGETDAASAILEASINSFLTANALKTGTELKQIGEQYWVASFLNGHEAYANFRRSGFPLLSPNTYPGKSLKGDFINRLTYPSSEQSVNKGNLDAAVARQGADDLDTKLWWDK
jgi:hypothetical protein